MDMDLSVVIPTLNSRDRLAASLDSLADHAPGTEVIVVNGPSADGTTGMVRDRDDVDVLIEISERNPNVARNAGLRASSGYAVAFLGHDLSIHAGWAQQVRTILQDAPAVTGPLQRTPGTDRAGERNGDGPDRRTFFGREVTYFHGGNAAFTRPVLEALDGFDEYLQTGGSTDVAHRLAGLDYEMAWDSGVAVRPGFEADGGGDPPGNHSLENRSPENDSRSDQNVVSEGLATTGLSGPDADQRRDSGLGWRWTYRALTYTLVKNYGPRPGVLRRVGASAVRNGIDTGRRALRGDTTPTGWIGSGRDVGCGIAAGLSDGIVARWRDRSPTRNPNGVSTRADRAVARYDRRVDDSK